MSERCDNCERVATELRAEFNLLRQQFVRRMEDLFAKVHEIINTVDGASSKLLADIEATNGGLLVDIDRRFQRLCDTFSERLQNASRRMDEGPPKLN